MKLWTYYKIQLFIDFLSALFFIYIAEYNTCTMVYLNFNHLVFSVQIYLDFYTKIHSFNRFIFAQKDELCELGIDTERRLIPTLYFCVKSLDRTS